MSEKIRKRIEERNELLKQMMIHKSYQAEAKDLLPTANGYMEVVYGSDWDKDDDDETEISVLVVVGC